MLHEVSDSDDSGDSNQINSKARGPRKVQKTRDSQEALQPIQITRKRTPSSSESEVWLYWCACFLTVCPFHLISNNFKEFQIPNNSFYLFINFIYIYLAYIFLYLLIICPPQLIWSMWNFIFISIAVNMLLTYQNFLESNMIYDRLIYYMLEWQLSRVNSDAKSFILIYLRKNANCRGWIPPRKSPLTFN